MTGKIENAEPVAELTGLLEAWGGTPGRWPPHVRLRIDQLCATGPRAKAALAEARALDQLLDCAHEAPAALSPPKLASLGDRIAAAASAEAFARAGAPPAITTTARIIPLPTRSRTAIASTAGRQWPAAGLMAASLMAGLYLGGSMNLAPVFQELADAVGLPTMIDPMHVALGEDLSDEDAL